MSIRCGRGHRHETVSDVRRCYSGESVPDVTPAGSVAVATRPTRPTREVQFNPETLEDGFYVRDNTVYKVIVAVHGSGRKYAKQLDKTTGVWEMAPGAVRTLRPHHRMTLAQAIAVAKVVATDVNGQLYGRCFVCGRPLTAEDSIDRMMGPVCAGKFS